MIKKYLLFDLDGTLLNTNNLVLESLKYTIRTHLGQEVEETSLYKYFGQPLVKIMEDLDKEQADKMVGTYRQYSATRHDNLIEVFPQVSETLKELKEKGIPIAVVTSKLKPLAYRGLELFNLDQFIDICVAYEDTPQHKPDPAPVLKAIDLLGITNGSAEVIMVGDSPYDIMCANNAGVTSAAVKWSLHPPEVLGAYNPNIWLDEFSAILNYV